MKILALEFSSHQRSVAAGVIGAGGESIRLSEAIETGGRSVSAFAMIERVLGEAQIEREQLDCLAVALGPGSYHGIRVAIALAQGWQLVAPGIRTIGISSAECLAAQAHVQGLNGRVSIVIDAQRQEFYLASFDLDPQGPQVREPLRLASLEDVSRTAKAGNVLVGPEVTKWWPDARILVPRAASLLPLAAGRSDAIPAEKLEPIYLRQTAFVKAAPPRRLPQ